MFDVCVVQIVACQFMKFWHNDAADRASRATKKEATKDNSINEFAHFILANYLDP